MYIENADGDTDGQGDEDHGEEQVLAQQRHGEGGGRDDLSQQEEEHGEGEEDGDTESNLKGGTGSDVYRKGREDVLGNGRDGIV